MTLLEREIDHVSDATDAGEEALIKEARRLRRRRWMIGFTLAALGLVSAVAGFLVASGPPSGGHQPVANGSNGSASALAAHVFVPTRSPDLLQPGTLATLPNGNLLILDGSRDQILELKPGGQLSVFAGNGRLGSSGDGGPARDAELDSAAGLAVAPDGNTYVLDGADCRIRAISPNDIIRTVLRLPVLKVHPHGTWCPISAFAVSPTGNVYVANSSKIERLSSSGHLVWVAGAHGSKPYLTPSHVAFFPGALAFNKAGELYIWNSSPKLMFRLTPSGKLTELPGVTYATELTTSPPGTVFAGTHGGEVQTVTPSGVHPFYAVIPKRVAGIHWGPDGGFQEDGIAVTKTGAIYVDNAAGNGYGAASVLVQISPTKHAALVPIRTPLTATLPVLGASGFPASLYPRSRASQTSALSSCPSDSGLERFTAAAITQAEKIAKTYLSSQFASDITVTDRSWWNADFNQLARVGGGYGTHTIKREEPASKSAGATAIKNACGPRLLDDSVAITIGKSSESDLVGTLYLLDRSGHPLVYDVH